MAGRTGVRYLTTRSGDGFGSFEHVGDSDKGVSESPRLGGRETGGGVDVPPRQLDVQVAVDGRVVVLAVRHDTKPRREPPRRLDFRRFQLQLDVVSRSPAALILAAPLVQVAIPAAAPGRAHDWLHRVGHKVQCGVHF